MPQHVRRPRDPARRALTGGKGGKKALNEKLIRFMSLLLRHRPGDFGLKVDEQGYADLGELIQVLEENFKGFALEDLEEILRGEKERFEVFGPRIRARYGHSFTLDLRASKKEPPEVLYHGTHPSLREKILTEGLQPLDRSHVHLSLTPEDALTFGRRHAKRPLLFKVFAKKAHRAQVDFYDMGSVFLSGPIPPEFLEEIPLPPEREPRRQPGRH